ncbi:Gfo/Idh/MocA family oxidoreductase [Curtobacterium sp. MCPF17_052]|uniref:Gfo/Idh/MocA family oxidoreductase n=1 Tax=Curtobacterium sp. MCPF17_052 TaxID=2175655 RepID=UPI003463EC05
MVGVGLISVGWMGRLHSRAYRALPDHFPELGVRPRLVVAADPVPAAREQATERLGYERAVADWHEVLTDPEVDVVSICSPELPAPRDGGRGGPGGQAVLDREADGPVRQRLP